MLLLIVTDRDKVRLVEEDIRRHQCRISKQTAVDVLRILCGFVLKLGHTAQLAEHSIAIEHPTQLCMLVYMALYKQSILLRIQTAGNVLSKLLQSAATQVCRSLTDSDGMHIRHKIKAFKSIGTGTPVLDRTQVIAQMQITAGLNTG